MSILLLIFLILAFTGKCFDLSRFLVHQDCCDNIQDSADGQHDDNGSREMLDVMNPPDGEKKEKNKIQGQKTARAVFQLFSRNRIEILAYLGDAPAQ